MNNLTKVKDRPDGPEQQQQGSKHPNPPLSTYPSSLELTLRALNPIFVDPAVTDVCINRPREAFIGTRDGWRRESLPFADFDWCRRLAKLVAHATRQRIDESHPMLSASLPDGETLQIVLPPAVTDGSVAITIQRQPNMDQSIDNLAEGGIFRKVQTMTNCLDELEAELLRLLAGADYPAFLRLAIKGRKNIVISAPMECPKNSLMRALIREISAGERLVTIEHTPQLTIERHLNSVRLISTKDDRHVRASPKQLLECALKLRPDRIVLPELGAEEAFAYLRMGHSAHGGSITSIYATTPRLAFEEICLLVKEGPGGRHLTRTDIRDLLYLLVDIVIQCGLDNRGLWIQEIWFNPALQRRILLAENATDHPPTLSAWSPSLR